MHWHCLNEYIFGDATYVCVYILYINTHFWKTNPCCIICCLLDSFHSSICWTEVSKFALNLHLLFCSFKQVICTIHFCTHVGDFRWIKKSCYSQGRFPRVATRIYPSIHSHFSTVNKRLYYNTLLPRHHKTNREPSQRGSTCQATISSSEHWPDNRLTNSLIPAPAGTESCLRHTADTTCCLVLVPTPDPPENHQSAASTSATAANAATLSDTSLALAFARSLTAERRSQEGGGNCSRGNWVVWLQGHWCPRRSAGS